MSKKFYITTAIPYVNASPHIGFALELLQTDAVARYHRQLGEQVYFLTGADENSLKNVQAAEKEGLAVKDLVDRNTQKFIELADRLNVSNDDFIRTTESKHFAGCQKLWQACKPEDIYKKQYRGKYCVGCEQFYTEKELENGICPEHKTPCEDIEEENYFFKLSNYQEKLEQLIESDEYQIFPESRKNEVLSFIRMGLQDFSISRSQKRARNWGVPVPGDESQVVYVWFDALSNYITALDYDSDGEKFKQFWPADVHVVGKGIIRFHAVYWPAMLLSAGLPLPKKLFVHGYINIAGEKMSKSLGNVIDPFAVVDQYGLEPVRYFLLRHVHPFTDSDFSPEQFEQAYNADLCNGLGNLVSRVAGLIEQNSVKIKQDKQDKQDKQFDDLMNGFQFDQALKYIWDKISVLDGLIAETKPWQLAKEGKTDELQQVLDRAANGILEISNLLIPFMPETAQKIIEIYQASEIKKGEPLFPRLASK